MADGASPKFKERPVVERGRRALGATSDQSLVMKELKANVFTLGWDFARDRRVILPALCQELIESGLRLRDRAHGLALVIPLQGNQPNAAPAGFFTGEIEPRQLCAVAHPEPANWLLACINNLGVRVSAMTATATFVCCLTACRFIAFHAITVSQSQISGGITVASRWS